MTTEQDTKFCVILPAYREAGRIGRVISDIRRHANCVVVVDDGSTDGTADEAGAAGAVVLRHAMNQGKGAALNTAFRYAREKGFEWVLTMDADGQHDPAEIPLFLDAARKGDVQVIVGNRMDHTENMPLIRRWTNLYMSWLLSRRMGQRVPDTQSGYRLYRAELIPLLLAESARFAAESEVLLRLADSGAKFGAVPIKVIYRDEKSKIRPIRDAIRFFRMLAGFDRQRRSGGGNKQGGGGC